MNYTDCRFLLRNLDVSLVFQASLLSLLIDISGSSQTLTGWFLIGTYIWASLQMFVFQMCKLFFSEDSSIGVLFCTSTFLDHNTTTATTAEA
jgi:hypothetical protein